MGRRGPDKKPRKVRSRRRFTADDIRAIRAAYAAGEGQRAIGERFRVTKVSVSAIVCRRTYADVE